MSARASNVDLDDRSPSPSSHPGGRTSLVDSIRPMAESARRFAVQPRVLREHLAFTLSWILVALTVVSSIAGLFAGTRGLYDSNPTTLPTFLGQDAITLFLGIPVLLIAMSETRRGSVHAAIVWSGTLFYFAYSYFFYVVGARFNVLFPVYLGIVASSAFGFLSLLFSIDRTMLRDHFDPTTPVRRVAAFLMFVPMVFALMWGSIIVRHLRSGVPLDDVARFVIAIDGTVALPLVFFGGLSLWFLHPWGYTLGGILLVKMIGLGLTLLVNTAIATMLWDRPIEPLATVMYAVIMFGSIALLVPFLRGLQRTAYG